MKPIAILFLLLSACGAIAHPGGLDANGGHTDRATGIYHYHRKTNAPAGTLPGSQAVPLPNSSTNQVSFSVGGETNAGEIDAGTTDLPTMGAETSSVPRSLGLPWWVYLLGLGGVYGVWEIAFYFYQKKKGSR